MNKAEVLLEGVGFATEKDRLKVVGIIEELLNTIDKIGTDSLIDSLNCSCNDYND